MIKAVKLINCTPYQQAELSDCKKVNFIFGANGSGKSTISSFLAGDQDPRFSSSFVEWDSEAQERMEVYNKAFRHANLQQEMKGVFTMGSATIEEIHKLEALKNELSQKEDDWNGQCNSYNRKVDEEKPNREAKFKEDAWRQILKDNEEDFQKAFKGFRNSKDSFLKELNRRIAGIPGHEGAVFNREVLLERAQTLYAAEPKSHKKFEVDIDESLRFLDEIQKNGMWNTVIVGSSDVDIAFLIEELGNSSWVSQGRQYIKAESKVCPFCQQETISGDFRQKLESFFDAEYERKVQRMQTLLGEYRNYAKQVIGAIESGIQDMNTSIQTGKLDVEIYTAKKELLKNIFDDQTKRIEKKILEPNVRISFMDITNIIKEITDLIEAANTLIDAHNKLVDQRDTEEISLQDDVWATCIHDSAKLIKDYKEDIKNIDKAINGIKQNRDAKKREIEKLSAEIEELGKNITSVQPAINEINRSLKAYGFTNFSIQPAEEKENYYCIKRDDGTLATNTLSEGEETFLAFLYFIQRIKGSTDQAHVSTKKIIVIDDPISSLDSTILYIVGTIIKDLAKSIRNGEGDVSQLFVLTHNVFFHKEASFIDGRTHKLHDVNYWIVRKNDKVATIYSYGMRNPISTSYELLWKEMQDNEEMTVISIQNTMRRILENYFGILGGRRDDYLINQFKSCEDKMIAKSLLCWVNDGSHSIPDDLFIDSYTDAVPKYKEVFRAIFENSQHIAHYNMMMGIQREVDEFNVEN